MDTIQVTSEKDYAVVRLSHGKANTINAQMVDELKQAFAALAEDDAARGVVLTGGDGCFSAGLDVIEVYEYDEAQFETFWRGFTSLAEQLYTFPKALVAAVTGYSPAGGCVLALCCDYRVMAEGKYTIGLNEIAVGLLLPEPIFLPLAHLVGFDKAYQLILGGTLLKARDACDAGLVNEVCPLEDVLARAESRLKRWLVFDDEAWRMSKANMRRPMREAYGKDFDTLYGEGLRQWWSPECRASVGRLVQMLKMKKQKETT